MSYPKRQKVIELLRKLDKIKELWAFKVGRYSFWPTLRYYYYLNNFSSYQQELPINKSRLIKDSFIGIINFLKTIKNIKQEKINKNSVLFLYNERYKKDLKLIEIISQHPKLAHYNFYLLNYGSKKVKVAPCIKVLEFYFIFSFSKYLSKILSIFPFLAKLKNELASLISTHAEEKEVCVFLSIFSRQYFFHLIISFFFRKLLNRIKPKIIFAWDGNGKSSEIKIAKDNLIPTIELQHGIFFSDDPDYNLSKYAIYHKDLIAVPDYIFVYGRYWKNLILKNKFYSPENINIIGSPTINYSDSFSGKKLTQSIKILFILQPGHIFYMLNFINSFSGLLRNNSLLNIDIKIKNHPLCEHFKISKEKRLAQNENVEYVEDLYKEIKNVRYVVGLFSSALIESLCYGKITCAIRHPYNSMNFNKAMKHSQIEKYIIDIENPEELLKIIQDDLYAKKHPQNLLNNFFARNSPVLLKRVLNDVLKKNPI